VSAELLTLPDSLLRLPFHPRCGLQHREDSDMPTANEAYRQAANSPAGREAAKAANTAADAARSVGDQVSDFASDMSREAGKQFGRAQDMAVDAYDQAHAAVRSNPLTAVLIALGLGFLFGVVSASRR
jgi:ElaB/YqjD/DUF883 family membrane-anchored ribosome-binding protein